MTGRRLERFVRPILVIFALGVGISCGDSPMSGDAPDGGADTVVGIFNDLADPAETAKAFRYADGRLETATLPSLGSAGAANITYANPGEVVISILADSGASLLRSRDDGRTFEPYPIALPPELRQSSNFYFAPGTIWAARVEPVFLGSAGIQDVVTTLWSSIDEGATWQSSYVLGTFGAPQSDVRFGTRAGHAEAYVWPTGEEGPAQILDLETGERNPIDPTPFIPTRYVAAGDRAWVAGNIPHFPDPARPAVATASGDEAWTLIPLPDDPPPVFAWLIDFVDERRGATCGLRRERVDNRSVVRGIGCLVTGDGGESWDLLEPLTGPDLEVDDVVYTRSGEIVVAAREGVSPSGVGGNAVLLLGSARGGSWQRRAIAGHAPVRLARSSAASRATE